MYKNACPNFEVQDNSALTLKSQDAGSAKTWAHPLHPNWQDVSIKETEWTVLLEIIKDILSEMDSLIVQQMTQARATKKKRRDSKVRRKLVEERMTDLQAKHEDSPKQQMQIESWQEQEGEARSRGDFQTDDGPNKAVPKWSDVFGRSSSCKERRHELMRKAPQSSMRPTLATAPP